MLPSYLFSQLSQNIMKDCLLDLPKLKLVLGQEGAQIPAGIGQNCTLFFIFYFNF